MPAKKNVRKAITTTTVVVARRPRVAITRSRPARSRVRRAGGAANNSVGRSPAVQKYLDAIMYPGIAPATPTPRLYGAGRVSVAYTRSVVALGTAAATDNTAIAMSTSYLNDRVITPTVVGGAVAFGASTQFTPGSFTITNSSINDCNFTAGSISVSYLSAPLNATGMILIGVLPEISPNTGDFTTATFNSLSVYPGVVMIPISKLIELGSITIFATKGSADAENFVGTANTLPDVNVPFVAWQGLPAAATLVFDIVRSFDFRSTVTAGNIFPVESAANDSPREIASYQEAMNEISHMAEPWYAGAARGVASLLQRIGQDSTQYATLGAVALHAYRNRGMGRMLTNNHLA